MQAYPVSVDLRSHLSIFSMAYRHTLSQGDAKHFAAWLDGCGWGPHHVHSNADVSERPRLQTERILTKSTRQICFPDLHLSDASPPLTNQALLASALGAEAGKVSASIGPLVKHNFALSLQNDREQRLIGVPLKLALPHGESIGFRVEWVDLWFFSDQTAILSFKVAATNSSDSSLDLDVLTQLNQHLRASAKHMHVKVTEDDGDEHNWWRDVVEGKWLGGDQPFESGARYTALGIMQDGTEQPADRIDEFSRYAKTLTMAEIPTLGSVLPDHMKSDDKEVSREEVECLWNAPVTDPPFDFAPHVKEMANAERMDIFATYHFATMEGYPTAGDYLLYDLASCGRVGAAAGFTGDGSWQVSPEYLRELLSSGGIEIWEYWRGLAMRDTLSFLVADEHMPMSGDDIRGSQAETLYYFIYVYLYHIQFKLNSLSDEIIDADLINLYHSRLIQNRFHQFRNQYWFRDITSDFQGSHIVDKVKEALRLDDSFGVVQSEITEVSEFISDKIDKGKQALIGTLFALAYPVVYLSEILGIQATFISYSESHPWLAGGVLSAAIMVVGYGALKFAPEIAMTMFRVFNAVYHRGRS